MLLLISQKKSTGVAIVDRLGEFLWVVTRYMARSLGDNFERRMCGRCVSEFVEPTSCSFLLCLVDLVISWDVSLNCSILFIGTAFDCRVVRHDSISAVVFFDRSQKIS